MQIAQHITDLLCPFNHSLLGLSPFLLEPVIESLSFYVIHYNEKCILTVDHIDNAGKIGMIQLLQNIGLRNQSLLYDFIILYTVFSYFFDRPLLVGTFVHREIYNAHASLADLVQYLIFTVNY